jgi:hypothetical protein
VEGEEDGTFPFCVLTTAFDAAFMIHSNDHN